MTINVYGGGAAVSVETQELIAGAYQLGNAAANVGMGAAPVFGALERFGVGQADSTVALRWQEMEQAQRECASRSIIAQATLARLSSGLKTAAGKYWEAESRCMAPGDASAQGMRAPDYWESPNPFDLLDPEHFRGLYLTAGALGGIARFGFPTIPLPDLDPEKTAEEVKRDAKALHRLAPSGPIETGEPELELDSPRGKGLPDLIDLQASAGRGDGALLITRAGTAENPTWVVTIPGTNTAKGSAWGIKRIGDAMAGDTAAVSKAVLEALQKVGAKPGSRLVLNGHSQGGRHAINLASDAGLKNKYNVAGVVTAGAPSGYDPVPKGVNVIQLEDPDDRVPGMDGQAAVPFGPHRMLIRGNSGQPKDNHPNGILGPDHRLPNYREIAEAAQSDGRPELVAMVGSLGLGRGMSTTHRVSARKAETTSGATQR